MDLPFHIVVHMENLFFQDMMMVILEQLMMTVVEPERAG